MLPPVSQSTPVDVAVVGAGPAGCAAARQLARWGHSVVLITRPEASRTLAESIPPSCAKLFRALDVSDAIERAGFLRSTGNTVWWGTEQQRSESFAGGQQGWQVLRSTFDRVLLSLAQRAGVRVIRDTIVRDAELSSGSTDSHLVRFPDPSRFGALVNLPARALLDCSGRAGLIARRGLRRYEPQSTVALVGVWEKTGCFDVPDETHTLVEAYAGGWAWSVPITRAVRYVTMMVDPRVSGIERDRDVGQVYAAELRKTREFRRIVRDAALVEAAWACDASIYTATQFAGPRFLLVGDAASFIDPLSSYGIKKALASAWLAAIVVHTGLARPEMWDPAADLFSRREREMFAAAMRQASHYFAQAGARHAHAFWTGRAEDRSDLAEEELDIDGLRRDPDVLAAWESLRRAPRIRLRLQDNVRVDLGPVVSGHEIVLDRRLVAPAFPSGLRFLRGIDLPVLLDLAPAYRQVPDLFDAYNRIRPPVLLPDFLGALSVMVGKRVLDNDP